MIMIIKETTKAEDTTDHPKAEDSIVITSKIETMNHIVEGDRKTIMKESIKKNIKSKMRRIIKTKKQRSL